MLKALKVFTFNFSQNYKLTFFFTSIGFFLFSIFWGLADFFSKKKFYYYLCQNIGIFLIIFCLSLAYAAVCYANRSEVQAKESKTFKIIKKILFKTPYLFLFFIAFILLFMLIIFLEVGFSYLSHLPYAGAIIMAFFTGPFFILIFFSLFLFLIAFFILIPRLIDDESLKVKIKTFGFILKNNIIEITFYLLLALPLFFLGTYLAVLLFKYSAGITKAIHWKISLAYPKIFNHLVTESFFSDLIKMITPRVDSLAEFKLYGFKIFTYLDTLEYVVGASYLILFSLLISFPLALFYKVSADFVKSLQEEG